MPMGLAAAIQFSSFAEFIDMGGYGFYIWSTYGMFLLIFVLLFAYPLRRRKTLLHHLKRRQDRQQQIQQEQANANETST